MKSSLAADVVTAGALAAVLTVAIRVAEEPGARPPDVFAYGLGALMAALVLVRRRWPLGMLLGTAGVLLLYYSLRYPAISPTLPLAVALYSAAAAGRMRWAVAVIGFFIGADLVVPLVHHYEPPLLLLAHVVERALGMVAMTLLGQVVRSRQQRLRDLDQRRTAEAAGRLAEERLRIARDIHDAVGHGISAISIQAALAGEELDRRPDCARSAIAAIREASNEALTELRSTVTVLRSDRARLDRLDTLLEPVRQAGVRVRLVRVPAAVSVPDLVDLAAYRIIQEALTNVLRHADATRVTVDVRSEDGNLLVDVIDDGRRAQASGPPGAGIAGMRERAAMLGGDVVAGRLTGGGFRVSARLPIGGSSE